MEYEVKPDGTRVWRLNGKRHREDGPAVIKADGTQIWCRHGKRHREDGPAVIRPDGTQEWYWCGQLHREDGPAIIRSDGTQEWRLHWIEVWPEELERYRSRKASLQEWQLIHIRGKWAQCWVLPDDGCLHREDGPAVIYPDGWAEWWLYGKRIRCGFVEI